MKIQEILRQLDLGNAVAEFDEELERYFVVTDTFQELINDKADIIAGDKGTGKTAIYRYLIQRYPQIPELENVEILTGFNPSGSPIFQRLAYGEPLNEGQYVTVWKTYIFSLVGNWLLQLCEGETSDQLRKLDALLNKIGLRSTDDAPATIFSRLTGWLQRVVKPKAAGLEFSMDALGIPVIVPKIEFHDADAAAGDVELIDVVLHDDALQVLNAALEEQGITIWVALDRLDEAFVGFPEVEFLALRGLFRAYLDFLAFRQVRLKLFVRKDLFRKITSERFVNLTHINARKREIIWDEADLFHLLCQRMRENPPFMKLIDTPDIPDQSLFDIFFPDQVDPGERRPTTWKWILSHICDGSSAIAPRNLIDLANKAKEEQLRSELRSPRHYPNEPSLLEPTAVKKALSRLSRERVEDTLMAEASKDVIALIRGFTGSKAEHNDKSIAGLFGVDISQAKIFAKTLLDIGFLEPCDDTYRIPLLYREGLNITPGKAFRKRRV